MRRQWILSAMAALYVTGLVMGAFLVTDPVSMWAAAAVWFGAGVLVASAARPGAWWVVLGFLWLGSAWVEAGQAVWLERQSSALDVVIGCAASALGAATVWAIGSLRRRQLDRGAAVMSARTPAAPHPR